MQAHEPSSGGRKQDILRQALKRKTPLERAAFLDGACGGDAALRVEMEAWLERSPGLNGEAGDGPLEKGATEVTPTLLDQTPLTEGPGTVIGRYKLLEQIGEGGFGVVYVAEQQEPVRRQVALKIIKLGMDTRQVVARFEAERQALALMDHPNIAKVFDAGATDSGRPFFVMELVKGIPITKYCDQEKLSTHDRLKLFIAVCQAIQHAHQKGIIHRDIKPSNILVTVQEGKPVPKVIDFGIAKATQQRLTEKTLHTQLEQLIGTPAYMSPEQAEMSGLDIDTRSDIYSLGVLLYELLTARTPFDAKELLKSGLDEMRKIIRESEPPRPSTKLSTMLDGELTTTAKHRASEPPRLIHLVRGDLDWIVMKCLEKDRTRRYDTANGLAADLKRHLDNEPVVARPPSTAYRFQKLVRRNKLAFAAAGAVGVALLLGIVVSTWQAVRASRAQREQKRLFNEAEAARAKEAALREQAVQAHIAAERNLYAADILLAFQATEKGNLGRVRRLLAAHQAARNPRLASMPKEDPRGWEWRYLWGCSRGDELITLRGHSNSVPAAVFLNDGRTAVSASADQTVRFWNIDNGSLIETRADRGEARRAAISPDGRWFAIGGRFGYWSLWDAATRQPVMGRTNATGVKGLAFSPDSRQVAVIDSLSVEVWNVAEKHLLKSFSRGWSGDVPLNNFVLGIAFSPDAKKVAYAKATDEVVIHDLQSDNETTVGKSSHGNALSLAFRPDGRVLAWADRTGIALWDLENQAPPRRLTNHLEQVVCLDFSPDGKLLASASGDQTIKLWNTGTWEEVRTLKGHEDEVHTVRFSRDGKLLISAGKDETVRVWKVDRPGPPRNSLTLRDYSLVPRANQERALLLSGDRGSSRSLDLKSLSMSPVQATPPTLRLASVFCSHGSSNLLAIALREGPVEIWRTEPFSKLGVVAVSPIPAFDVALGETGQWLAVQRTNDNLEIWDVKENRLVKTFLPEGIRPVHLYVADPFSFFAGDRRLVRVQGASSEGDEKLEVLLLPEKERKLIYPKHKGASTGYAIDRDGFLLATAGWDGLVKLWDLRTGKQAATLSGQMVGFMGLAFSPEGSRLAAGGWDGSITLWDVRTRQQVAFWKAHPRACGWLSFVDDGRVLVSTGETPQGGHEVSAWRAPSWEEIEAAEKSAEAKSQ